MKNDRWITGWILGGWVWMAGGCAGMESQTNMRIQKHAAVVELVRTGRMAEADEAYAAYRLKHENSPQVPRMILSLIRGHLAQGEYRLARFYCDEYYRDFPSGKERDEVDYLHLKILFYRYDREHDDRIAEQARTEAKRYLSTHGNFSPYRSRVEALLEHLRQREKIRNEELAEFYEKRGKPKAAAFYREKAKKVKIRN